EERLKPFVEKGQVKIHQADASKLSFLKAKSMDAAFLCWFLEHVPEPLKVLKEVRKKIKAGGRLVCTEVNNSSLFVDPYSPNTLKYWYEFNDHQWTIQGHPFVGLQLGNLLHEAQFSDIQLEFRPLYFDNQNPHQRKVFLEYFFNLFKSANEGLVKAGRVEEGMIQEVRKEFETAMNDKRSVFFYSFVRAIAIV
ncbi:MAG: methyltransferase domain-containing protein, partial [Bdellovibrionales bacterium]|nr:methyltransferase domain-containing protein [Bdellovibrionales bacterium]